MASEGSITFSDADIASTAEKLVAFGSTLTPGEQGVLCHVIAQAAQAGQAAGEVSGYFTLIERGIVLDVSQCHAALLGAFAMGDGSVRSLNAGLLLPAVQ